MRAWRFSEFGDIRNLDLGEHELPRRANGEVLIRLRFAALNPADRLLVEGKYPGAGALPLTVGRDGSGTVEEADSHTGFAKGDCVLILRSPVGITRQGTLAEFVTVPAESVTRIPDDWSFEEGAAASVVYLTAWNALAVQGGLRGGETVLINGASGGVGVACIQVAKALGARVVALSRDAEKRAALATLGADFTVDSSATDAEARVRSGLDGGGADLLIENLGGGFVQMNLNLANQNGRIMVIGLLSGRVSQIDMGQILFKQARIEGVHVGRFTAAEAQQAWRNVVDTLRRTDARPRVDSIFAMEDVHQAFERLKGNHMGKVLVEVGGV